MKQMLCNSNEIGSSLRRSTLRRFFIGVLICFLLVFVLSCLCLEARADIVWEWSFAGESGRFHTDGTLVGGDALPGTYLITDFAVVSSETSGTLGSLSGGQYSTGDFATDDPYFFVWDGQDVTQWLHSGDNLFDWQVYQDNLSPGSQYYWFGWRDYNINDYTFAAHYDWTNGVLLSEGALAISPIPEPITLPTFVFAIYAFLLRDRPRCNRRIKSS